MKKQKKKSIKPSFWEKIKNALNNSPWHSAFTYPILFLTICFSLSLVFFNKDLENIGVFFLILFFLTPLWVLFGLIVSKRRLPYLLSLIIGLAIPMTIGIMVYNGVVNSAKKMSIKSMHYQARKNIVAEIQKCNIGESKFMSNSQDCPATAVKTVRGAVNTMNDKNPYDTSRKAVRESNSYTKNEDVGYISLSASGSSVLINTCVNTPCKKGENRLQDIIETK